MGLGLINWERNGGRQWMVIWEVAGVVLGFRKGGAGVKVLY